jgi:hypothetical protein
MGRGTEWGSREDWLSTPGTDACRRAFSPERKLKRPGRDLHALEGARPFSSAEAAAMRDRAAEEGETFFARPVIPNRRWQAPQSEIGSWSL